MNYNFDLEKKGESKVAKFRSVTLGGAGLMKRSKRFLTFSGTSSLLSHARPKLIRAQKAESQKQVFRMSNW